MLGKIVLFGGLLIAGASLSTLFWGDFQDYGSNGEILVPIIAVAIGGSVFVEYAFNKPLVLGLISVPVDAKGFRALVLCAALFLMILPLLIALGVYE